MIPRWTLTPREVSGWYCGKFRTKHAAYCFPSLHTAHTIHTRARRTGNKPSTAPHASAHTEGKKLNECFRSPLRWSGFRSVFQPRATRAIVRFERARGREKQIKIVNNTSLTKLCSRCRAHYLSLVFGDGFALAGFVFFLCVVFVLFCAFFWVAGFVRRVKNAWRAHSECRIQRGRKWCVTQGKA